MTIQRTTLDVSDQEIINLYTQRYKQEKRSISLKQYIKLGLNLYHQFLELKTNNDLEEIKETIIISEFGKRLFHPLIGFIKKVRKYILIDGEETVSVDIKTSQVIFLAQLLKERFNDDHLADMVKQGVDIYELIAEEEKISRKQAKKLFFFYIFGWKKTFSNAFKKIFTSNTLNNIVSLKYTKVNNKVIKNKYSNLVYLLQELESMFTIRATVDKFIGRNISFLTVHDEFIVKKSELSKSISAIYQCAKELDLSKGFVSMLSLNIS